MVIVFTASMVLFGAFVWALLLLTRKVASAGRGLPVTTEWIGELSVERYRPMQCLLDGRDIRQLRSQPGFTPRMAGVLRMQRVHVFREYLRCLSADYVRTCAAIKVLMLQSRRDRPDLAAILVRSQMVFACGMLLVQVRVVLYQMGLCGVDVRGLIGAFDSVRLELRSLVPAGQASLA